MGRGPDAEWLGSTAWDGNPESIMPDLGYLGPTFTKQGWTEESYRAAVASLLADRDDATVPEEGWPWPWEDSNTTDYAYAYADGLVWASNFGRPWFIATEPQPETDDLPRGLDFPNMVERQKVKRSGKASGLIVIETDGEGGVTVQ